MTHRRSCTTLSHLTYIKESYIFSLFLFQIIIMASALKVEKVDRPELAKHDSSVLGT